MGEGEPSQRLERTYSATPCRRKLTMCHQPRFLRGWCYFFYSLFRSQRRIPKDSFKWFAEVIRTGRV